MTTALAAQAPPDSCVPTGRYAVVDADAAADRASVLEVWSTRESVSRTADVERERYDWFYLANPQGLARVSLLFAGDGSLVGSIGVGQRLLFMKERALSAGVLVDFVVDRRHRTVFPALMLQRASRERALAHLSVVYGLPNPSAQAVCKRLGSQLTLSIPRFARVVRTRAFLERMLPRLLAAPLAGLIDLLDRSRVRAQLLRAGLRGEWLDRFDERFDDLWAALDRRHLCIGVRDRPFLEWRFGRKPGHRYEIFAVRQVADPRLRMYFVCERSGPTLTIKDCLGVGSAIEQKSALLLLVAAARRLGVDSVDGYLHGTRALRTALARAGFRVRSHRPFFALMGEPLREWGADCEWVITQADEDV
jgi:hypothetical protein